MEISKIANHDIYRIKPLWEALNRHHYQRSTYFKAHFESFTFEERIKQFKRKEAFAVFVAQDISDLTGYCIASLKANNGEIDSIFVKPSHRNRKIGARLVESAESWLHTMGAVKLLVCVGEGNEQAFGFYSRLEYLQRFTVLEKKVVKKMGATGE